MFKQEGSTQGSNHCKYPHIRRLAWVLTSPIWFGLEKSMTGCWSPMGLLLGQGAWHTVSKSMYVGHLQGDTRNGGREMALDIPYHCLLGMGVEGLQGLCM